jgi:hypothetical protein
MGFECGEYEYSVVIQVRRLILFIHPIRNANTYRNLPYASLSHTPNLPPPNRYTSITIVAIKLLQILA